MKFNELYEQYMESTDKTLVYRAGNIEDGRIIWTSVDYDLASEYAAEKDMEVEKFYLNIKNPIPIRKAEIERTLRDFIIDVINYADSEDINLDPVEGLAKRLLKTKTEKLKVFEIWDKYTKDLMELLTKLGFDSIKTTEGGKTTYGVFNKSQLIKAD